LAALGLGGRKKDSSNPAETLRRKERGKEKGQKGKGGGHAPRAPGGETEGGGKRGGGEIMGELGY